MDIASVSNSAFLESPEAVEPGAGQPLLVVRNIQKHFGGVHALRGAQLELRPGEVHVLMGENGAGKSTLAKVIAGVVTPDAGEMLLNGRQLEVRTPVDAQRAGIGIVFQELDLFPNLTVEENVVIENHAFRQGWFVNRAAMRGFSRPFLDQVGFRLDPGTRLGELSVGQMQLVAIARALSMNARLILMDEPTSALGDEDVERLFALLRRLTARGVAIVYVSHKMQEIFQIADRITVMRDGAYIGTREARGTDVKEIITMMVGRELADAPPRPTRRTERRLLAVRQVSTRRLSDISFELFAGEVLGVAGLVGAGRSELGAALFGLDRLSGGSMELNGADYRPRGVREAVSRGIGLVPEDRKGQGLMMQMSVRENCTLSVLPEFARGGFVNPAAENRAATAVLDGTRVKAASYDTVVSSLSGGNQQKVLLGRWLQVNPEVLFLDDPTRGIDVGAKRDIYGMIDELAERGKGIIFVSSELPELIANCDRILVLHDGRAAGCLDARSASQEQIMELATRTASS